MKTHLHSIGRKYLLLIFFSFPLMAVAQCTLMPGSTLIDSNDESNMTTWLGTNNYRGTLIYKMSRDGNTPAAFHSRCDNQGPTLVIIKSSNTNQVFGGYNPQSWTSTQGWVSGSGAFLFNLTYNYKLNQTNPTYQTYNYSNYGPTFGGGHDIYMPLNGGAGYNYPYSYENPTAKGYTYLSGTYSFLPAEVEVYKMNGGDIIASGSTNVCAGQSVALTAPVGDSYLWSTGASSRTITVNQTGDYSVQVSSSNSSCPTITPHQIVTVAAPLSLSVSQVNASGPGACDGSVVLQPSGGVAPYNASGGIDFSGPTINTSLLSYGGPGATFVQNGNLKMKGVSQNWDNYVFTNQTTPRTTGKVFQGKVYNEYGSYAMIGWHDNSTNPYYTSLIHALYFYGDGGLYIYEKGGYKGNFGTYNLSTWYDFKIELMAPAGAKYYLKEASSSTWNLIYTSYQYSDSNLRMGLSFYGYGNGYPNSNFYTDDWSGAALNPPLTNLCAGTYEFTITDSFGCTATRQVTITETNPVSFSATSVKASCSDSSTGSISITASGGTPAYQYSIDGGSHYQGSGNFIGLPPGSYSLMVKDSKNTLSPVQSLTLTFEDKIVPTVITRNIVVLLDATGNATIAAGDVNNGSTDNCAIASYALDITRFDCSKMGLNTVTLTVMDVNGNAANNTSIVTVQDNLAPTVVTQNIIVQLDAGGAATITPSQINNGSTDNCLIATYVLDKSSFACSDVGVNTVTLTVTDVNSNSASKTATVTIQDNLLPTVATQNITVQLGASGVATITPSQINNGSTDNCSIATSGLDKNSFDCSDVGANTVTLTVTDVNGNSASATAVVTVVDNSAPVVTYNDNITVASDATSCGALVTVSASATDNCTVGSPTGVRSDGLALNAAYPVGTTTITWNVTDDNGNAAAEVTQTVVVTDNTKPAITTNGDQSVNNDAGSCGALVTISASATDNCTVGSPTSDWAGGAFPVGTTTVNWSVTDIHGNTGTVVQTVIVSDNQAPVITGNGNKNVSNDTGLCGASVAVSATATDNCSVGNPGGIRSDNLALNAVYPVGTTTIIWTVKDVNGNPSSTIQTVTVTDNQAPVITTNGNKNVNNDVNVCGAAVIVSATATDNCSVGTVTGVRSDALALNATYPVGTTTIKWNVTDVNGNAAIEVTQTVVVTNADPVLNSITVPAAPLPISSTVPVVASAIFTDNNVTSATVTWDTGFTSTAVGVSISGNTVTASKIINTAGIYTVTITVTDACGKTASITSTTYIVVYDPNGSFVTGGGWIDSPAGASSQYPGAVGKANFGFVSKYQKGATIPTGNTEFQFKAGDLNFSSTSYQWLVVSGYKAQYKGVGTINGLESYNFLITAIDGAKINTTSPDRFRIKITTSGGGVIYDNQMGQAEDSEASTIIAGGSIVIHSSGSGKRDGAPEETGVVTQEIPSSISVYPNPVEDVIYVKYTSDSQSPIGMQLIDLNGRGLRTETYQANEAGEYEMGVSNLNMTSGFYLLRIAQDKSTKTIKLYKR